MFFSALCGSSTDPSFFSTSFSLHCRECTGYFNPKLADTALLDENDPSSTIHSYPSPSTDSIKSIWFKISHQVIQNQSKRLIFTFIQGPLYIFPSYDFPFFMLAFIILHIRRSLFSVSQYMTDYTACLCCCNRTCCMSSAVMNYYFGLRTKHFYRVCIVRVENNPKKNKQSARSPKLTSWSWFPHMNYFILSKSSFLILQLILWH